MFLEVERQKRSKLLRRLALSLCVLCMSMLSACSFAPDYERPGTVVPDEWLKVQLPAPPLEQDWWKRFNDPVLTALIEEALRNNQDIAASLAKVDSAAAKIGQARSALFPELSGSFGTSYAGTSLKGPNVQQTAFESGMFKRYTATNTIGFAASWELDLWGKYRNSYTGLTDLLLNTKVGLEALRLSVAGQVAQAYFTLLAFDMQLNTARRTLKSRRDALKIYSVRFKEGDITELDYLRSESEMELARASMLNTSVERDSAEAALAVLVGRNPQQILQGNIDRGMAIQKLRVAPIIPPGVPSDLLSRRPDIRAAEYMIMAYNANIGVVKADLFPSISLTGALGALSTDLTRLLIAPAGTSSVGLGVAAPLLDFGRRWYAVDDAEAVKRQSIAVYQKTIQTAFQDVRTALTAQRESTAIVRSIRKQVNNYRRAVELARLQYNNGYADYLTVLDTERQLFTAELQLATALSYRLSAVVRVCMALGGGWVESGPLMGTSLQTAKRKGLPYRSQGAMSAPAANATPSKIPGYRGASALERRRAAEEAAKQGGRGIYGRDLPVSSSTKPTSNAAGGQATTSAGGQATTSAGGQAPMGKLY